MSYSRHKPRNIGKITIKRVTPDALAYYECGKLVAATWDEKTWLVIDRRSGIVEAIFYYEPNVNGWSASKSHAQSYVNRHGRLHFNPFELDSIP